MSRGVALPRRGSPKDRVLQELLSREQIARASELGLTARFLSLVAGVDQARVDAALELHFHELTQLRYSSLGPRLKEQALSKLSASKSESPEELKERLRRVAALNSTR